MLYICLSMDFHRRLQPAAAALPRRPRRPFRACAARRPRRSPRHRSPRQRSPRLGTEVWWHWGDPGERNSWRREGQTLQENDLYSLYMSMTLQFLWQNVHACVSLVGTNHIAFHLSASAWCLGPAGFGSVSHSSCSLSPICSAFVGAFRRFWFCLPPVEQQKTLSVERL